ncbi:ubiquitin elongating factor core-domain-containing protein [Boeremia exigua]|uniref:ubiquitin elongating factor core-domain-containing protein n=1 Tax=Boeremia exigua TaxID=749465 RepID=UPI001E8EBE2C|nr:ubiquitin elongating factor core-domain-containing protein [Boeremia exigua]KAH6639448.1 ubiquitin elongating factor core-domain-containing protein [Boeremia exigua]
MADQEMTDPPPPAPEQDTAMSDADKIRAKRLAKLGGSTPRPSSTTPGSPSASGASSPKPPAPQAPSPQPRTQSPLTGTLQSQTDGSTAPKPASRINIKSAATASSAVAPPPAPSPQDTSIEGWEHQIISGIFRITLDERRTQDVHGHKIYHASSLKQDLQDEGRPLRFTTDVLDSVVLEAASSHTQGNALEYLLGCWKRVARQSKSITNKSDPKYEIVRELRRICFNYAIFAATMPDMFGEEPPLENALTDRLLLGPEDDRGICFDFLQEACNRAEDDDTAKEALVGAVEDLSRRLARSSMNSDYKPHMLALRSLIRFPPLVTALVQSETFLPVDIEAQNIETQTLLGPFFRLSPMQGDVAVNYFSGAAGGGDKALIANAQRALRMTLQTHQDELFDISNTFIKNKDSRESMLNWFALTVNKNHKRRALQVDAKTVSSDGFMVNVTVVLDRLCEPFMDASFSKIDRIDIDYLRRSPRVDITDETKINADEKTSEEFYGHKADGTSNFISEVFFLTVAAHHYGTEAANSKLTSLQKDVKWLKKELEKFETERHKYASNPGQLRIFDAHVKRIKDQIERGTCTSYAIAGILSDETMQARSMQLMRYVIVWLLRLVSGTDFPKTDLQLPLPSEQSLAFRCLPEYFVEDIVGNFKFITRMMPHIITGTQCEELVKICIVFLRNSEYIKNPYLKSGLVTILYHGVWEIPHRPKGVLGDTLFGNKFAMKHLLHALMQFYNECESTGAHTQFYDKFNIRYEIFQVIKCIWPNPVYRDNLATEARVNLDFFVQFVNLLLNDVTFVLDESFTAFTQIHETAKELKADPNMDQAVRTEKEEKLTAAQSKAKSYMQLTNETVAMLKLFTEALADSFTKKEVVVRLAHMLDYNLEALVGPKKSSLKVDNPEEYGWNPRQMLAELTDVYLNLQGKQSFVDAVATDGRSYRPEYWIEAHKIMAKFYLKNDVQLQQWEAMARSISTSKEAADLEEADLGEYPDEYTDPLMATLMEDPVILPISKQIIDRSTIKSHLLSDPHDPFNRTPLKIEDVIANDALRDEILAWKADVLAKKRAERVAAAEGERIDTA